MTEQNQTPDIGEDAEGHSHWNTDDPKDDDTEGHDHFRRTSTEDDDTEGHIRHA